MPPRTKKKKKRDRTCSTCGARHTRQHAYCRDCNAEYMRQYREQERPRARIEYIPKSGPSKRWSVTIYADDIGRKGTAGVVEELCRRLKEKARKKGRTGGRRDEKKR